MASNVSKNLYVSSTYNPSKLSEKTTLLVVTIKSVELYEKINKHQQIYINLWISHNPDVELETKVSPCINKLTNTFSFNQKFIFTIPYNFLSRNNNDSCIVFEVFRVNKYFRDSFIGGGVTEIKYGTEKEYEKDEKMPELNGRDSLLIFYPMNSENKKGVLEVEYYVWKGEVPEMGGFKWSDLAMEYDEFIMGVKSGKLEMVKEVEKEGYNVDYCYVLILGLMYLFYGVYLFCMFFG